MSNFSQLPLLPTLLTSLSELKFHTLTDVQEQSLPPLLEGKSLVGVAETGSGKTLSFVLPMLHLVKTLELGGSVVKQSGRPRGLVLVPARELGEQVSRVFKTLTHGTRVRVRTAIGGSSKQIARQNVAGAFEILVATPGRLGQLMDEGQLRLDDVRMLVFDEADQMLDGGFLPVAKRMVIECPAQVQLAMFSATMPVGLKKAIDALFRRPPLTIRTQGSSRMVPTLSTENESVINGDRTRILRKLLIQDPDTSTILFVNTRQQCDTISVWLDQEAIPHTTYRGQMDRSLRRKNLDSFRAGQVSLLLTTDLGGRGLDIERVGRVINVHLPKDMDNYLHRVGRTARAGRDGLVVNLVTERDQPLMAKVKKRLEKSG